MEADVAMFEAADSHDSRHAPMFPAPPHVLSRAKLYIDAQHGLCNRLRAIASAAGIAERTDRSLVVVWRPDAHCEARMGDLLRYPGVVIEDDAANELRARSERVYNYMEAEEDARFEEPILAEETPTDGDVYVRSAYPLVGPHRDFAAEQRFLRQLAVVEPVRALVERVRCRPDVAVHIRMASGPGFEHLQYESAENWPQHRHEQIISWRRTSHVDRFIARLDRLVAQESVGQLFVAADLAQTYENLQTRYGDRIDWLQRHIYDRSTYQLRFALADLILLSRAPFLLASSWSSFSDMAIRLGGPGMRVEWSGFDF